MAAGKEIRTKISSIQSTQKITSAMEMVAASKMRKAQERMSVGKPYARRMRDVVGHIANAAPEYKHMYMEEREVKRVGFIIVSTDRGLCGGQVIAVFVDDVACPGTVDQCPALAFGKPGQFQIHGQNFPFRRIGIIFGAQVCQIILTAPVAVCLPRLTGIGIVVGKFHGLVSGHRPGTIECRIGR